MDLISTVYNPPRAATPWTVSSFFAPSEVRLYAHGRNALAEALRLAGVAGRNVLLPAFICRDLLSSVAAAGGKPVFHAMGTDFSPAEAPERWPNSAAVLAVDYFGFPQNLAPFEAYCRQSGAVLIEDAAHALFSRDASGRLLGARSALGVLSLRKTMALPNGGALLVNDQEIVSRLPSQPMFATARQGSRLKPLMRSMAGAVGVSATFAALTALRTLRGDPSGHQPAAPDSESTLPFPTPCRELSQPLTCADPAAEAARRRELWLLCDHVAKKAGLSPAFPALPDGVVPYGYALRVSDINDARRVFSRMGLTLLPWPELPSSIEPHAPAHYKNLALVHFLW